MTRARALGLAALVPLSLLVLPARPAAAQVLAQVAPVETTITIPSGAPAQWTVTLNNLGREAAAVRLRIADWRMSPEGAIDLLPPGATPLSIDGLVRFEPESFSIGAGESVGIRLTATFPDSGPPTRYGMLMCEVRSLAPTASWPGARAPVELASTLFLSRVAPVPAGVEFAGLSVRGEDDLGFRVNIRVWNGSDHPRLAGGEIAVLDSAGVTRAAGPLNRGTVPPRSLRVLRWPCAAPLSPGRYVVEARLDLGGPDLVRARTEFEWPLGRPLVLTSQSPAP